ncbi:MAG: hypothetical protein PUF32_06820 [Prevotella sp.]|nr:hypothetical protein [Prevotella sp.]
MNSLAKVFALGGIVLTILLFMHHLPTITVMGTQLRSVDILSDIGSTSQADLPDVLPAPKPISHLTSIPHFHERHAKGVVPIDDYSDGRDGGMSHFYDMLANVSSLNRPVRIAYFGDSFVEGDILLADLREMLQARFGGNGLGWTDCVKGTNAFRPTVDMSVAGLTGYDLLNKQAFSTALQSVNQRYSLPSAGAKVAYKATSFRPHTAQWQVARLFCIAPQGVSVAVAMNGSAPAVRRLSPSADLQMVETAGRMTSVSYAFSAFGRGTVMHGVALESPRGVILDNLGMRGIPGTSIATMPESILKAYARLRPYDLIVLHYGVNAVAETSDAAYCKAYCEKMKKSIAKLRRCFPQASILIVGVADRDSRTARGIHTMPSIELLSAQQNVMASECGVAFFNLFKAMGGKDSMLRLVNQGEANLDYTHINFKGGHRLAGYFYRSFLDGLDNYKRRKQAEKQE